MLCKTLELGNPTHKQLLASHKPLIREGIPAKILTARHREAYILEKLQEKIVDAQNPQLEEAYAADWTAALHALDLQNQQ